MPTDPMAAMMGIQNPALDLNRMRQKNLMEMKRNRELQRTTPGFYAGALDADVQGLEQDLANDPDTGKMAQAQTAYNQPFNVDLRASEKQDALDRLLMPKEVEGRYNVEQERVRSQGLVGAAQAGAFQRDQTADENRAAMAARATAGQQAIAARTGRDTQNKALESQAKMAEANGPSNLNPNTWDWLWKNPTKTGQEQAQQLRGQMSFDAPGGGAPEGPEAMAAQLAQEDPTGTPEELTAYAQSQGITDPSQIQALILAYQSAVGR